MEYNFWERDGFPVTISYKCCVPIARLVLLPPYLLQVRVVIQNAKGQVHKEEVMGVVMASDPHNQTTTRVIPMDMTLVEGVASESTMPTMPEQVSGQPTNFAQLKFELYLSLATLIVHEHSYLHLGLFYPPEISKV